MSKMQENMRGRAWQAIFSRAFFSLESAVIIALSIALFGLGYMPFDWWQAGYWLIFGVLAEALYLGVSVTDPNAARRAVDEMLTEQYDPAAIKNPIARERLKRALEYRRLIGETAAKHGGAMRRHLEATGSEINDWIAQIYELAKHIDSFEENEIINRDRRMVPHDLKNLQRRLEKEGRRAFAPNSKRRSRPKRRSWPIYANWRTRSSAPTSSLITRCRRWARFIPRCS
jgi:hypothetical protein